MESNGTEPFVDLVTARVVERIREMCSASPYFLFTIDRVFPPGAVKAYVLDTLDQAGRAIAEERATEILARDPGMLRHIGAVLVEAAGWIEASGQATHVKAHDEMCGGACMRSPMEEKEQ